MGKIVTLTTDFGLRDPYVGVMKGVILSINPEARIVDITHLVSPQNILEAAFLLTNAYHFFTKGSIHLCVVDPGVGGGRRPVAIETEDYTFVGPDNGVFSLILKRERVKQIVHLTIRDYFLKGISRTFHGRDIFAPAAAHLSLAVKLNAMGESLQKPCIIDIPEPVKEKGIIRGEVLYIDSFGNVITNIKYEDIGQYQRVEVGIKGYRIKGLSKTYIDGEKKGLIALIGSIGYLEIALFMEDASRVLRVKVGEEVKVVTG